MLENTITSIANFLVTVIGSLGYFGIFILMAIESTFLPLVPAELVLLPAGFLVSLGKMSFILALIFSTIGSLAGALINYYLALHLGRRATDHLVSKYGRFLLISKNTLLKSEKYFEEHGAITTLIGRLIIGIRHFISLPAGFAKMNKLKFCVYTSIGAAIYSAFLLCVGYLLGNNLQLVRQNISYIMPIIILVIAITIISYMIINIMKKRRIV